VQIETNWAISMRPIIQCNFLNTQYIQIKAIGIAQSTNRNDINIWAHKAS